MRLRWGAVVLLILVGTGCATSRVVRLDTSEGRPIIYTPRADAEPVELDEDEIGDAGEKYGKVMGKNAARAFVLLAMAALGSTAQTLAARIPTLPGSAQATLVGVEQGGHVAE